MTQASKPAWTWPRGQAAVSLTYDDGNEDNLDLVIPDLEAVGLRATFYLNTGNPTIHRRAADWRAAHQRGHEIGNHSIHHPCSAKAYTNAGREVPAWMKHTVESHTPATIEAEVGGAADWLDANIGPDPDRTYAYPCGAMAIGDPPDEKPYDAAVLKRCFAARGLGGAVNDPRTTRLLRVSSFHGGGGDGHRLIDLCAKAITVGGWTVLYFHRVGPPGTETTQAAHKILIDHLRAGPYWVAPFKTVARHIQKHQQA
ncbi:MAG: polysaccharide deacetylase family protein [Planctomycetota bacterium]|nr:polysaccharide deacetylase family protein [Planctomycetota bacterium]